MRTGIATLSLSGGLVDKGRRAQLTEALRGFTFASGFGRTLEKLLDLP